MTTKIWKQTEGPLIYESIIKMGYTHTVKYDLETKRSKVVKHAIKWINLKYA